MIHAGLVHFSDKLIRSLQPLKYLRTNFIKAGIFQKFFNFSVNTNLQRIKYQGNEKTLIYTLQFCEKKVLNLT